MEGLKITRIEVTAEACASILATAVEAGIHGIGQWARVRAALHNDEGTHVTLLRLTWSLAPSSASARAPGWSCTFGPAATSRCSVTGRGNGESMKNRRRRRAKEVREIRRRWNQMILDGSSFQSRVRDLSWLLAHGAGGMYPGVEVLHLGSDVHF